jgi:hypothetical protein
LSAFEQSAYHAATLAEEIQDNLAKTVVGSSADRSSPFCMLALLLSQLVNIQGIAPNRWGLSQDARSKPFCTLEQILRLFVKNQGIVSNLWGTFQGVRSKRLYML